MSNLLYENKNTLLFRKSKMISFIYFRLCLKKWLIFNDGKRYIYKHANYEIIFLIYGTLGLLLQMKIYFSSSSLWLFLEDYVI